MTDLVLRLRAYSTDVEEAVGENRLAVLVTEAADTVEKLSIEVERLKRYVVQLEGTVEAYKARWRAQ